jgi:hypothetical protein
MGQIWVTIPSIAKSYVEQITSDGYHNIQIQANKQAKKTSVKKIAPNTVAAVLVKGDADPRVDPNDVRAAFRESFGDRGRVIKLG